LLLVVLLGDRQDNGDPDTILVDNCLSSSCDDTVEIYYNDGILDDAETLGDPVEVTLLEVGAVGMDVLE
jgi:hypothetical protein